MDDDLPRLDGTAGVDDDQRGMLALSIDPRELAPVGRSGEVRDRLVRAVFGDANVVPVHLDHSRPINTSTRRTSTTNPNTPLGA